MPDKLSLQAMCGSQLPYFSHCCKQILGQEEGGMAVGRESEVVPAPAGVSPSAASQNSSSVPRVLLEDTTVEVSEMP